MLVLLISQGCSVPSSEETEYDLILRHGTIYDGSAAAPFVGDVAIRGDTLVAMAPLPEAKAKTEIDVKGMAVAPGFINMMSWGGHTGAKPGRVVRGPGWKGASRPPGAGAS